MFVAGLEFSSYNESILVNSAVERQLLIVAEAAKRLGDSAQLLFPGPDWRSIRGLGNVLRHEYDDIDSSRIWHVVRQGLPALKQFVEQALRQMPDQAS